MKDPLIFRRKTLKISMNDELAGLIVERGGVITIGEFWEVQG